MDIVIEKALVGAKAIGLLESLAMQDMGLPPRFVALMQQVIDEWNAIKPKETP
jgi:hypothetical protein